MCSIIYPLDIIKVNFLNFSKKASKIFYYFVITKNVDFVTILIVILKKNRLFLNFKN